MEKAMQGYIFGWITRLLSMLWMEFLKPRKSCKTSCFFLNDAMFWRCFWKKNIDVNVLDVDRYLCLVNDEVNNGLTSRSEQYTLWSKVDHCIVIIAGKLLSFEFCKVCILWVSLWSLPLNWRYIQPCLTKKWLVISAMIGMNLRPLLASYLS